MRKILFGISGLVYLLTIAFFAFRPFKPIIGLRYPRASLEYGDGAVHIQLGAALEDRHNVSSVRKALMKSGQMSLAISLQTDSLDQSYPAQIVSYSRDCMSLNFTLLQEGNGLSFILRTGNADNSGTRSELLVPQVFITNRWQHLVMTYSGSKIQLFVDGKLHVEQSGSLGDFSRWGRNHAVVIGDEPAGGRPWNGQIRCFSIYDRALDGKEVAQLNEGGAVPGAVLVHDFCASNKVGSGNVGGLRRLRYRNLFITGDVLVVQLRDCVANIAGFLPLGFLVYMLLPAWLERHKILVVIVVPAMAGLLVSGSIEWLQRFILWRVPNLLDIIYNLTGTLLGSLSAWLVHSKYVKWRNFGHDRLLERQ